jgi:hypothetical protein
MLNIWDCFSSICGLILRLNEQRRTTSQRRTVQPQVEHLEKREVLSADASASPPNTNQFYQQLLQAEAHPTASQAPFLEQSLTAAAVVLPTYSQFLNAASTYASTALGPPLGQQYMQEGIQQVNSFLLNLEDATFAALNASGDALNPTFLSNVAAVNAFMNNPLNYASPG